MRMWSRYSGPLSDRLPHAFIAFVLNPANAINSKYRKAELPRCGPLTYLRLGERNVVTDMS